VPPRFGCDKVLGGQLCKTCSLLSMCMSEDVGKSIDSMVYVNLSVWREPATLAFSPAWLTSLVYILDSLVGRVIEMR